MSDQQLATASALLYAAVFAACAVLLFRGRSSRVLVTGHGTVAALLLLTAATLAAAPTLALAVAGVVGTALVPALVTLHPDGRPTPGVGAVVLAFVVVLAGLGLAYPALFLHSGLGPFAAVLAALVATWWRYERPGGPEPDETRRAVLWVAAAFGGGLFVAGFLTFAWPSWVGTALGALVLAPAPFSLVVASVRPDLADVRAVVMRVVVEVVALWLVVTVYVGVVSTLEVLRGSTPSVGEAAIVAAVAALVLQPARRVLRVAVERLVLGDRDDPVQAASAVGRTLAGDPVQALEALRASLALPYAALVHEGAVVARSGEAVAALHHTDLVAGGRTHGRLDVGLRPGQHHLARPDRAVLDVVAPALAQALHARALSRQLHDSRAEVIAAVEDERRRLRHDLHDGLGPTLTGIAFAADAAANTAGADPDRSRALIAALRSDAADAIVEVRRLVDGLRPPAIDELGLVGALRQQVRSLHAVDGLPLAVRLDAPEQAPALPAAVEVATYRIVTEALTNVARHSGAHDAAVRIEVEGGHVRVRVTDSGRGDRSWDPGVGLASMRERAEQLGGTFDARAVPGEGGRVDAVLPLGS